jgi:hypothetical protein
VTEVSFNTGLLRRGAYLRYEVLPNTACVRQIVVSRYHTDELTNEMELMNPLRM